MKQRTPEEIKAIVDDYVKKKRERGESDDLGLLDRIMLGSTGLGMLRGNVSPVVAGVKGNADLWHGSPAHNLLPNELSEGILNEGLNLRHAGKNQRLNNLLMSNSAQSMLEEFLAKRGRKITGEDEQYLTSLIEKLQGEGMIERSLAGAAPQVESVLADSIIKNEINSMRDSGGNFKSLADRVMGKVPELSKKFNIPEEELKNYFEQNIGRLGKRIYFGTTPESVAYWSGLGNEGGYAANKVQKEMGKALEGGKMPPKEIAKTIASSVANQMTGGYFGSVRESMQYGKPETTHSVKSVEDLKKYLQDMGEDLHRHNVLMQFNVPTRTLDSMADLPVARRVIQSSPGFKEMMGRFFPQADPSKDLSISENVAANRIKAVDLVDKVTGKLKQRVNIEDYAKPSFEFLGGKGNRLKTLKNIAAPAALSLAGAGLLYKALKPNKSEKDKNKKISKQAAADPKTIATLLGVPAALGLGLAGGSYLADKGTKRENYSQIPSELEEKFTPEEKENYKNRAVLEYSKGMMAPSLASLAGTALHTFADPSPMSYKAGLGGYASSQMLAPSTGPYIAMAEKSPDGILPGAESVPRLAKLIREHPYISGGLISGLTLGALPASAYYVGKKYYPYHTNKVIEKLKAMKDEVGNDLKSLVTGAKSKTHSVPEYLKQSFKHLRHNLVFPALGVGGAALSVALINAIERAKNKAQKHIEDRKEK